MSLTLPATTAHEIVRFLLDRLDEDDDVVRRLGREDGRAAADGVTPDAGSGPDGLRSTERLRAEVIAKRHVIGDLQQLLVLRDLPAEKVVRDAAVQALRALAAPYADHRQYRSEWRAPKRR